MFNYYYNKEIEEHNTITAVQDRECTQKDIITQYSMLLRSCYLDDSDYEIDFKKINTSIMNRYKGGMKTLERIKSKAWQILRKEGYNV
jgi:hypothetical protein